MSQSPSYDAVLAAPFGRLGIRVHNQRLIDVNLLPARTRLRAARDPFVRQVCQELARYLRDPRHPLRLPLALEGTAHQRRVWRALQRIPVGEVRCYGDLAKRLRSSARAVGAACRSNPVAIVVPCHRVVSRDGLGGFMGKRTGAAMQIKRWLLAHERR